MPLHPGAPGGRAGEHRIAELRVLLSSNTTGDIWWPRELTETKRAGALRSSAGAIRPIASEVERKYGAPLRAEMAATGDTWFYAFEPR